MIFFLYVLGNRNLNDIWSGLSTVIEAAILFEMSRDGLITFKSCYTASTEPLHLLPFFARPISTPLEHCLHFAIHEAEGSED
jgi:hypothetical protein